MNAGSAVEPSRLATGALSHLLPGKPVDVGAALRGLGKSWSMRPEMGNGAQGSVFPRHRGHGVWVYICNNL